MDEHRVGLKPILRRVWAKRGERPIVAVRPRYEWLYIYAFVCPETGETEFWLAPCVNGIVFRDILRAFLRRRELRRRDAAVMLVLDQAGWHIADAVRALEQEEPLQLKHLPPYSPELMPAERLWELTDEPLVNAVLEDLAALEAVLAERCVALTEQRARIRQRTLYHWWPGGAGQTNTT